MAENTGFDKTPVPAPDYDVSKVPEPIRRRSNWTRTKFTGDDVLESVAQIGEIAGLYAGEAKQLAERTQIRQDAVEDFNTQVIQEMTDKDVISAPELIEARKGEDKLSLRLQKDFNIHKKVLEDRGVNPLDFGCMADGVTDDTDGFQQVMDFAIANNRPILVTGEINIVGTLLFRKFYDRRNPLRIEGGGKLIKRNAGCFFSSDMAHNGSSVYAGNIRFTNLTFESLAGSSAVVLDPAKILRAYFSNVDFIDVDHLIKSTGDTYAQTIYLNDVVVAGGKGYFIDVPEIYDFSFVHSVCEHRESLVRVTDSYHSMRILDNVIEGMTGQVANIRWGQNLDISKNYFEHNSYETNAPYIEFTFGGSIDSTSAVIENNHFVVQEAQLNNPDFYLIKSRSLSENIAIKNNSANANLLDVLEEASLAPNVLAGLMTNRINGGKKITKDYARVPVQTGQGNLLTGYAYPNQVVPSYTLPNSTVVKTAATENALEIRAAGGGVTTTSAGFRTTQVSLRAGENVVVGIEGKPLNLSSGHPQLIVRIVGVDDAIEYYRQNSHHVRNITNIGNLRFISLPSLKITKTQKYYVELALRSDTPFSIDSQYFLLYNLYLQYGTIANKSS